MHFAQISSLDMKSMHILAPIIVGEFLFVSHYSIRYQIACHYFVSRQITAKNTAYHRTIQLYTGLP